MSFQREIEQCELEKKLFSFVGDDYRPDLLFRRDKLLADYQALKDNYFNDLKDLVQKYEQERAEEARKKTDEGSIPELGKSS